MFRFFYNEKEKTVAFSRKMFDVGDYFEIEMVDKNNVTTKILLNKKEAEILLLGLKQFIESKSKKD